MATRDERVDAFIAKAQPFAKPILTHIRRAVHAGCPACVETIKWGMPHFEYHGKTLCGMAAFTQHAALIMWNSKLVAGDDLGRRFRRVTSVSELPSKRTLAGYVKKAMALHDAGAIPKRPKPAPRTPPRTPPDLAAALKKSAKAQAAFAAFPPSHKREYVEWITSAKGADTRARRVATAAGWIAEGKPRNWKYMKRTIRT